MPVGGASGDDVGPDATSITPAETVKMTTVTARHLNPAVTNGPTIDLTANDAAMVKLFKRLGALKGAASFFVLDQGINSLAAIHDLDDDAIESLCKLCRKPKPGHHVALHVETQFQLCNFYLQFKAMTLHPVVIKDIGLIPLADLKAYRQEVDQAKDAKDAPKLRSTTLFDFFNDFRDYLHAT